MISKEIADMLFDVVAARARMSMAVYGFRDDPRNCKALFRRVSHRLSKKVLFRSFIHYGILEKIKRYYMSANTKNIIKNVFQFFKK